METLKDKKVLVEYPCKWEYKLIGESEKHLQEAVFELIDIEYEFVASKVSKKGKYKSFNLTLEVKSDEHRIDIFNKLKVHSAVKMVL